MHLSNRILTILLFVQIILCVLSGGFSPAVLFAFALMIAGPISFFRLMEIKGIMFVSLPVLTGVLLFQTLILSPVFLSWFVLVIVASAICWNRGVGRAPEWN
jgi:hypothetical protein